MLDVALKNLLELSWWANGESTVVVSLDSSSLMHQLPLPPEESLLLLASQGIWERVQAGQRYQKDVCVSCSIVSDSLPLQGL